MLARRGRGGLVLWVKSSFGKGSESSFAWLERRLVGGKHADVSKALLKRLSTECDRRIGSVQAIERTCFCQRRRAVPDNRWIEDNG